MGSSTSSLADSDVDESCTFASHGRTLDLRTWSIIVRTRDREQPHPQAGHAFVESVGRPPRPTEPADGDVVLDVLVVATVGVGVGAPHNPLGAFAGVVVHPSVELEVTWCTSLLVSRLEAQIIAAVAVGVAEHGVLGAGAVGVGAGADVSDPVALERRGAVCLLVVHVEEARVVVHIVVARVPAGLGADLLAVVLIGREAAGVRVDVRVRTGVAGPATTTDRSHVSRRTARRYAGAVRREFVFRELGRSWFF